MESRYLNPYRMPAEWEPHDATWLSWPHNPDTWPGKHEPVPAVWVEFIRYLTTGENVHLNVNGEAMKTEAASLLQSAGVDLNKVVFEDIPTDDCWMRDCGPIFVRDAASSLKIIDWEFNKWGGKYPPWDKDNKVPQTIAKKYGFDFSSPGIVMEGGSIEVNGMGSLITTETCLLNKNRNPHLSQKEIEHHLQEYFGVSNILWLGEGIAGDDTDGHVDDITRFVSPRVIVTAVEEDPADENHKPLQENLKRLEKMKDEQGRAFEIVTLPMPGAMFYEDQRLPASYANFYIANKVVVVPVFKDEKDGQALTTLQKIFPDRKVVGIDSRDLIWGLGAFHCISQQVPRGFYR